MSKKTIVLGAVAFPSRYAFKAVHALVEKGHEVVPLGIRDGVIADLPIIKDKPAIENVDTFTMYLNAGNQQEWYEYIVNTNPKRVVFNPGSENREFSTLLRENKIDVVEDCTLVMLAVGRY